MERQIYHFKMKSRGKAVDMVSRIKNNGVSFWFKCHREKVG